MVTNTCVDAAECVTAKNATHCFECDDSCLTNACAYSSTAKSVVCTACPPGRQVINGTCMTACASGSYYNSS